MKKRLILAMLAVVVLTSFAQSFGLFEPLSVTRASGVVYQPQFLRIGISTNNELLEETKFNLFGEVTLSFRLGSLGLHAGVGTITSRPTTLGEFEIVFDKYYVAAGVSLGGLFVSFNSTTPELTDLAQYEQGDLAFGIASSRKTSILTSTTERTELSYTIEDVVEFSSGVPNFVENIGWLSGRITLLVETNVGVPAGFRLSLANLEEAMEGNFNLEWEFMLNTGIMSLYLTNNQNQWIVGGAAKILFLNVFGKYFISEGTYSINAWIQF